MNEADLIFGKVPFIFTSTYCQSRENWDGRTAGPRCLSELNVYSLPLASSSPDARLEFRGDPEGLGAPPGKGSSARIFPGNIGFPCRPGSIGAGHRWGPGGALRGHGVGCTGSRKSFLASTLHPAVQLHSSVGVGSQRPSRQEALCFCESCPLPNNTK